MDIAGKTVAFLGDSITEGVGASCIENRYTDVFARLTGGVAYNEPVNDVIREHCSFLAPIFIYPGEDEMGALMLNALSVLRGERTPKVYA